MAKRIKASYDKALTEGRTTGDLGGPLGTKEFAATVSAGLSSIEVATLFAPT